MTWLSWSSGKDSAWALHVLRAEGVDVTALLCTVNETHSRVAMHAVRRELLHAQAESAGVLLVEVPIPSPCSNAGYEAAMNRALARAVDEHVEAIAFGDLFLEDVRRYREKMLAPIGIRPLFPLWGIPTDELARRMIAGGLHARITCVDPRLAPGELAGQAWEDVVATLPVGIDPCGERGEFHTFTWSGPMFRHPILVQPGQVVERDGFVFADLTPTDPAIDRIRQPG
jgi:uncharacterized protein (TIGR00290 family)